MTLLDHLKELRKRLIISSIFFLISSIIVFCLYDQLIQLLSQPLNNLDSALGSQQLFINSFFEGFITKFRFGLLGGFVLSIPAHLYQVLRFIFPGLKRREKFILSVAVVLGNALAIFAIYLTYFFLLPVSINFLTTAQFIPENVGVLLNFNQNIFYIFNFLCFSVLLFQSPILLLLLMYFKLIKRKALWSLSRYMVVIIFVLTALITPPDIISQVFLAVPLIALYFLTLLIAKLFKLGEG